MAANLTGKTAVVTGASRGFGLEVAHALARAGARVVVGSRSSASVEAALAGLRQAGAQAVGAPLDIARLHELQNLARLALQTYGGFDIWVNNAAISAPYGPAASTPPEEFEKVLHTNIFGTLRGSLLAVQYFLQQPEGSPPGKLINILGDGYRRPLPMQIAYGSSKAWMLQFTRSLAQENPANRVGVFAFNPGLMHTDLVQKLDVIAGFEQRVQPLRTVKRILGQPAQIPARRVVWLASSATDGKTGLVLRELTTLKLLGKALSALTARLRPPSPDDLPLEIHTIPADPDGYLPK